MGVILIMNLNELMIVNEQELEKLNKAIDRISQEKSRINFNRDILERLMERIEKVIPYREESEIRIITPIKYHEMLRLVMDFYKSIDEEIYQKVKKYVLQQEKGVNCYIYNPYKVDKEKLDSEIGIEYSGSTTEGKNWCEIHIPLTQQINFLRSKKNIAQGELDNIIPEATLQDAYVMVHEIGHVLDFNIDQMRLGKAHEGKKGVTRQLLTESTALALEKMFSKYLLKNKIFSKKIIQAIDNIRENLVKDNCRATYYKLVLYKEKEKNGQITEEFLEKIMRDKNFSRNVIRRIVKAITNDNNKVWYQEKYAIAKLIAPSIFKKYEEGDISAIKEYLQSTQEGNLKNALLAIGMENNKNGIEVLFKNLQEEEMLSREQNEKSDG